MKKCVWRYALLLWLISGALWAQKQKGTMMRVEAGPSFLDLATLNESLNTRFFETIPENYFAVGLSLERFHKRLVLGGQLYNFMLGRSNTLSPRALLGFQHLQLQAGVVLVQGEDWVVYPTIGAGGGMATFKAFLQQQQAAEQTRKFGLLGHGAVHFRKRLELDDKYLYELGVSAGYTRTLSNNWTLNQFAADLNGIPISPEGFFIRVSMGMGTWR